MEKYDVIVIGAGQAGCAAAFDLASAGCRVLLLGNNRYKPCAGALSPRTLKRLRFSVEEVVRDYPRQQEMLLNKQRGLQWQAPMSGSALVDRAEFDAFCRDKAIKAGAEYHKTHRLLGIRQCSRQVQVETDTGNFTAINVIAADGVHSPSRRLLLGDGKAAGAFAIEAKLPANRATHYPIMHFDFGAISHGYGWMFPKGDHINVGLYTAAFHTSLPGKKALKDYVQNVLGCRDVEEIAGYPLGTCLPQLLPSQGRVLFAGDAAGCCEPLIGEGIYAAVLTGQKAATVILSHSLGRSGGKSVASTYAHLIQEWRMEQARRQRTADVVYAEFPPRENVFRWVFRTNSAYG